MGQKHFYKKFPLAIVLTLLLQIVTVLQVLGQCDVADEIEILQDLVRGGWVVDNTWNVNNNTTNWTGVVFENGCVTQLDVGDVGLAAMVPDNLPEIPNAIGDFTNIRLLRIKGNGFTGTINENIYKLTTLETLLMQQNEFQSSISDNFNNLEALKVLGLDNIKNGNETEPEDANPNFMIFGPPPNIPNLENLEQFFIRNHEFYNLPNFPEPGKLTGLGLSGNYFTFEDLLPLVQTATNLSTFFYKSQKPLENNEFWEAEENTDLTISFGIDENITSNVYTWYKRDDNNVFQQFGEPITGNNDLVFNNIQLSDAGIYRCYVTNPAFQKIVSEITNTDGVELVLTHVDDITVQVNRVENGCQRTDRTALVAIYNALGGNTWKRSDNWNSTLPVSEWKWTVTENGQTFTRGVVEVNDNGCVTKLDLTNNDLSGQFPNEFGDLLELEELRLGTNNISGPVHTSISDLTKLRILHIYENNLGGNLSDHASIFSISSLEELLMYTNNIGGTIPPSIAGPNPNSGLKINLNFLSLGDNNLTGELPNEIYQLTKLSRFHLNQNQLSGSISTNIGNLRSLTHLWISENNFSGQLPTELGNIDGLNRLWFENNEFTFGDLIPLLSFNNFNSIETIWYSPQSGFTTSTPFTGTEGEALEVTVDFKDGPNNTYPNLYSWYKDGETEAAFDHSNVKTYTIDPLALIDAGQYEIRVTNPEFHEVMKEYSVDINRDGINDNPILEIISTNKVEIIVNEGNNPPTDIELDNTTIDSDAQPNSLVGNLTTVDDDLPNDSHIYTLTNNCDPDGTNDNALFAIADSELRLASDFVLPVGVTSLKVCITTTDEENASFSKEFTVQVNLLNNPPTDIFLSNNIINSDAQPNMEVGTLTTEDLDENDTHTYTLTTTCDRAKQYDNALFAISDDKLVLSPDFALPVDVTSFTICVTTTDESGASFSKEFTIRVNALNNPPTDITLDNNVIDTDAQVNGLVGNLTTVDADLPNDTHTYTLTNECDPTNTNNNALFAISGSELRLAADFALPTAVTSLTVCITTTDEAGDSFSKTFTIQINILNNPPTDILLSNTIVDAVDAVANFEIGTLSTVDDDNPNDTHVYTFTDDCEVAVSNGLFAINGDRLLLGPSYVYDAAILSYNICVTSTDRAGESTNKSFEITIRPIVDDCITNDRAVLEALYDALGGDNWNDNTNWKSTQPLDQWFGVETNENGCVTRVILEDNNLVGTIPTEVGNFSEILEIHFGKNNISGTIPADFGKLTTLEFLWLNENNLGGQIPTGFFGMSNLTNLYLFQNNLQPPMPNQLNQLTKLLVFGFDNNETPFVDNDFPAIGNLTVLQKFYIQNHDFEDVPTITNPALLTEMGLASNRFTFEDLLPFSNLNLEVFLYAPQDSVGTQNAVTLQKDETFTIDLGIDINITNSVYRWYKDGELVEESNSNTFSINQVSKDDEGEYTCEVTNPDAPDLTLYARKTTLTVIDTNLPPPVLTAELDPANPAERIILSWTYPTAFTPESYTLERSVGDSTNFSELVNNWTENVYTDGDGLMPGETYFYRVLARVDGENSPYSNVAFVTTNSLPVVNDIDKTGAANTLIPFTLADFTDAFTDVDNDPLATVQILSLPANGQLSLNGGANININDELPADQLGNLVFTPTADFIGSTSFDYNASDGYNYALNPASVNITIEEVEDVDLVVNNPQTNTSQVEAGNEVSISADIAIDGDPTSEEALFVLLLSTDTLPNNGDIELTFANVPTGAPQQINTSVMIPEDLEPGEYFLIYYIDAQQAVTETDEINNVKFLRITILPEGPQVTIMNLITANGDGSNDMLYVKNIESYPDNEVLLLDRWGNVVGEFPDYNNDWTPVVGQDIPDFGSYLCIVKLNELQVTVKRMVSIIRDTNQ